MRPSAATDFHTFHSAVYNVSDLIEGRRGLMQVVVVKSPRLMSCILRMLFKIKKDEESS